MHIRALDECVVVPDSQVQNSALLRGLEAETSGSEECAVPLPAKSLRTWLSGATDGLPYADALCGAQVRTRYVQSAWCTCVAASACALSERRAEAWHNQWHCHWQHFASSTSQGHHARTRTQVADFLRADIFPWAAVFCGHLVSSTPSHAAAWAALQQHPQHFQDAVLAQHPVLAGSSALCVKLDVLPTYLHVRACRSCYRVEKPFLDPDTLLEAVPARALGRRLTLPHLYIVVPATRHIAADLAAVLPQLTELRSLTLWLAPVEQHAPASCAEQLPVLAAARHMPGLRSLALAHWQPSAGDSGEVRAALWSATQLSQVSLSGCTRELLPRQAAGATLHIVRLDATDEVLQYDDVSRKAPALTGDVFPALQHVSVRARGKGDLPDTAFPAAWPADLQSLSWYSQSSSSSVALTKLLPQLTALTRLEWWPCVKGDALLRRRHVSRLTCLLQLRHLELPISLEYDTGRTPDERVGRLVEFLAAATCLSHLRFTNSSGRHIEDAPVLRPAARQQEGWPALQVLRMPDAGHSDESLVSMLECFSPPRVLTRLSVSDNPRCGAPAAAALVGFVAAAPQLRELSFANSSVVFATAALRGLRALERRESPLSSVTALRLGTCEYHAAAGHTEAVRALAAVLSDMHTLASLDVGSGGAVCCDALVALCTALGGLPHLRILQLRCPVLYAGTEQEALAQAVSKLRSLEQLDVGWCGLRDDCQARALANLGRGRAASAVVVARSSCGNESVAELSRLLRGFPDLVLHVRDDGQWAAANAVARLREAAPHCNLVT